uniref:Uncharacterized protein n=1 Tax=Anguilla anguilla TaxID=7936 RepID=A0A0E9S156_ANGAN
MCASVCVSIHCKC